MTAQRSSFKLLLEAPAYHVQGCGFHPRRARMDTHTQIHRHTDTQTHAQTLLILLFLFFPLYLSAQKIPAGLEHKNGEMKPKSRRRWGLISRSTKGSDDWADLDDLDFSPSLTRIDVKNKRRQSEDTLCRQVGCFSPWQADSDLWVSGVSVMMCQHALLLT